MMTDDRTVRRCHVNDQKLSEWFGNISAALGRSGRALIIQSQPVLTYSSTSQLVPETPAT